MGCIIKEDRGQFRKPVEKNAAEKLLFLRLCNYGHPPWRWKEKPMRLDDTPLPFHTGCAEKGHGLFLDVVWVALGHFLNLSGLRYPHL